MSNTHHETLKSGEVYIRRIRMTNEPDEVVQTVGEPELFDGHWCIAVKSESGVRSVVHCDDLQHI